MVNDFTFVQGYVPQDEVDSYRSKGKKFADDAKAMGVPGFSGPTPAMSQSRPTNVRNWAIFSWPRFYLT